MESYDRFYRENKDRVFAYLLRLTGNYQLSLDFMQESFTRYFARYRLKGSNLALLYTIARNTVLDSFRKHREESLTGQENLSFPGDPERQLMEKQACHHMMDAIQKLNPVDRELIALLAAKTFSYREIGELLNLSETNVRVKVHRARLRLKDVLKKGGA